LVDDPSGLEPLGITAERVQAKLGWLVDYREALSEWSADQAVIDGALDFVRCRGLYLGAGFDVATVLPTASGGAAELREELIHFVRGESLKARVGERLPGTTAVLESCFGKLKALEDGQSKSGFTGLVLSLGAMVSKWTAESLGEALERCRVRDVAAWCRKMLVQSVQSQRKQAYGPLGSATKPGWTLQCVKGNFSSRQPRTPEGKNRSKFNAVKHGMSAKTLVLPGEDDNVLQIRLESFMADLQPQNAVEQVLVEQAVHSSWLLDRASRAELARLSHLIESVPIEEADRQQEVVSALGSWLLSDRDVGDIAFRNDLLNELVPA
jgi:hypothetical protein